MTSLAADPTPAVPSEPQHTSQPRRPRPRWLSVLAIVLLTALPIAPTLRSTWVYDDTQILQINPLLKSWHAMRGIWSHPYWPDAPELRLYRPFHITLMGVIYNLGGGQPVWFHVYAICLAALTALAVWWLLRRAVGNVPALVGALWFGTHPLHVEAVASVTNSSELLVVLFTVALTAVMLRWRAEPARARRDWLRAAAIGVLAAGAVLSKESGIIALPLAALCIWGWVRRDGAAVDTLSFVRENMRAWVAAAICVGSSLAARAIVLATADNTISLAPHGLDGLSTLPRVTTVISLWPRIVQMLVWPAGLSPLYGPSIIPDHRGPIAVATIAVVVALAAAVVLVARRGDRRPLVGAAWMALAYLPASNLFGAMGPLVSDRTLFGVTAGLALVLAWALDVLPRFPRQLAVTLAIVLIARDVVVTTRQALDWTRHRMLWTRLVNLYPDENVGHHMLGLTMWAHGDTNNALAELARGVALAPGDNSNRVTYGRLLYAMGRYGTAVQAFAPVMRSQRGSADTELAAFYFDAVGRSAGAAAVIREANKFKHGDIASVAALYIGLAEERLGRPAAADSAFSLGLKIRPGDKILRAEYQRFRGLPVDTAGEPARRP